jgi:hypothetical protein
MPGDRPFTTLFAVLRKIIFFSEAAMLWDPSVTTGFDSQHPGDRDASLAVFLLRFIEHTICRPVL